MEHVVEDLELVRKVVQVMSLRLSLTHMSSCVTKRRLGRIIQEATTTTQSKVILLKQLLSQGHPTQVSLWSLHKI